MTTKSKAVLLVIILGSLITGIVFIDVNSDPDRLLPALTSFAGGAFAIYQIYAYIIGLPIIAANGRILKSNVEKDVELRILYGIGYGAILTIFIAIKIFRLIF